MKVRTEVVDGLTFIVPTWDKERGSWAEDPELEERCLAAIRERIPNHEELVKEALESERVDVQQWHGVFWGSHGCDRGKDHEGLCVCRDCSLFYRLNDTHGVIWWFFNDGSGPELCAHSWQWFT
jgi:hypothetical protein